MSLADPLAIMQERLLEHAMQSRGLSYFLIAGTEDQTWSVYIGDAFAGYISRNEHGQWRDARLSTPPPPWRHSRFAAALCLGPVSAMRYRMELPCPPPK